MRTLRGRFCHLLVGLAGIFALALVSNPGRGAEEGSYSRDAVYQYSVPVRDSREMRAYLWIPPECKRVRGVVIGIQNMLEQTMFSDPEIRQACADCGLGIVFITPGDDSKDSEVLKVHAPYHTFNPGKYVADHIVETLQDLAVESGYAELAFAPMIPTAHSAATPFGWGLTNALPDRMIAFFPCKGWFEGLPAGVPTLHMGSEYGEVGGKNWGETYLRDRLVIMKIRQSGAAGAERLIGEAVDIGAGHYEWNPDVGKMAGMFIRKAVALRLPEDAPVTGPVSLKEIDPASGVLIDPDKLGTREGLPVAYKDWPGDKTKGLWYFDAEMARTVNDYMVAGLEKKPEVIDFVDRKGVACPLIDGGGASLDLDWLSDGYSFRVAATFLDQSPTMNLYGGQKVGHSTTGSILFKAGSGCLRQTGPDTFRVWVRRGGYVSQGSPWDPQIIAYFPGDAEYRRADRPGHPWVSLINQDGTPLGPGTPQTLDLPKVEDQLAGVQSLQLQGTASSGMPVQFWVVSGPVELADDNRTLKFLPIPPASRFPIRVILGAYQWGRRVDPKVESALPVTEEFFIKKRADDPTGAPEPDRPLVPVAVPH